MITSKMRVSVAIIELEISAVQIIRQGKTGNAPDNLKVLINVHSLSPNAKRFSGQIVGSMIREKLYCTKCGCFIGEALHDHQVLRLGENVDIWNELRYHCRCGRPRYWKPKSLPEDSQTDAAFAADREIRMKLGRKRTGAPPRVPDNDFEE